MRVIHQDKKWLIGKLYAFCTCNKLINNILPQILSHVSPEVKVIDRLSKIQIVNAEGWDWTYKLAPTESIDLFGKQKKMVLENVYKSVAVHNSNSVSFAISKGLRPSFFYWITSRYDNIEFTEVLSNEDT